MKADIEQSQKRLKTKLRFTKWSLSCVSIVLAIFVCLYISQVRVNNTNYTRIFNSSLANASKLMNESLADNFDKERKYREITAELGICCEMSYLIKMDDEHQKVLNELYFAYIKLPSQMNLYLSEVASSITYILNGQEIKGYTELNSVIENLDKSEIGG